MQASQHISNNNTGEPKLGEVDALVMCLPADGSGDAVASNELLQEKNANLMEELKHMRRVLQVSLNKSKEAMREMASMKACLYNAVQKNVQLQQMLAYIEPCTHLSASDAATQCVDVGVNTQLRQLSSYADVVHEETEASPSAEGSDVITPHQDSPLIPAGLSPSTQDIAQKSYSKVAAKQPINDDNPQQESDRGENKHTDNGLPAAAKDESGEGWIGVRVRSRRGRRSGSSPARHGKTAFLEAQKQAAEDVEARRNANLCGNVYRTFIRGQRTLDQEQLRLAHRRARRARQRKARRQNQQEGRVDHRVQEEIGDPASDDRSRCSSSATSCSQAATLSDDDSWTVVQQTTRLKCSRRRDEFKLAKKYAAEEEEAIRNSAICGIVFRSMIRCESTLAEERRCSRKRLHKAIRRARLRRNRREHGLRCHHDLDPSAESIISTSVLDEDMLSMSAVRNQGLNDVAGSQWLRLPSLPEVLSRAWASLRDSMTQRW